jgi:hypothetical protein
MRVYLPADVPAVRALIADGALRCPVAHAVTDALRAEVPDADEEELEYLALLAAAADSAESRPPGLRVVLAADVPSTAVAGPLEGSVTGVRLGQQVPIADVAAAHVDETAAGDPDDRDLLWYAVQELPDWLAGLA